MASLMIDGREVKPDELMAFLKEQGVNVGKGKGKGKRKGSGSGASRVGKRRARKSAEERAKIAAQYGESPVGKTPTETIRLRNEAITAEFGEKFKSIGYVYHVGVLGNDQKIRISTHDAPAAQGIVKHPWTWLHIDAEGKKELDEVARRVLGMSGDEFTAKLKSMGYGWSAGNERWCSKGNGKPGGRFGKCYKVGRSMDGGRSDKAQEQDAA